MNVLVLNKLILKHKNKQYYTINCIAGLNNRLRVILSYLHEFNNGSYPNKKLRIIWLKTSDCPDFFYNLFQPLENVEFNYNLNKIYLGLIDTVTSNAINNEYINKKYYNLLKPINSIQNDINAIKNNLTIDYIACHIRRTDLKILCNKKNIKYSSDDDYINFINSYSTNLKIYIATDNELTQNKFINLYKNRLVYKKIIKIPQLRQTSIQDAVKDMYVCAGATYFMGSTYSSFTDTIMYLRQ